MGLLRNTVTKAVRGALPPGKIMDNRDSRTGGVKPMPTSASQGLPPGGYQGYDPNNQAQQDFGKDFLAQPLGESGGQGDYQGDFTPPRPGTGVAPESVANPTSYSSPIERTRGLIGDAVRNAGGPTPTNAAPAPQGSPLDNIRGNIPALDTRIDPSQFASDQDVAVANTVQSDVSTLEPPTDINAANIGDYTPYDAVSAEVTPDMTVEGRLSGLLSQNNPYIKRARTEAMQFANRRGMLNSGMAAGAAEGAAIDRALPIAQQDAITFREQQFRNQGYDNDAARYLAEQSVQRENLEAGLEQDTRQFNQENLLTNQRLNTQAQNLSSQEFAQAQNLANANAAAEWNRNNFAVLSADLQGQLKNIDNQAAMNLEELARQYSIMENLDSVNGSIYQQLVAEIGTIIANTDKASEAQAKVNALIESAGLEFAFSNGTPIGGGGGGPSVQPIPGSGETGGAGGGGNTTSSGQDRASDGPGGDASNAPSRGGSSDGPAAAAGGGGGGSGDGPAAGGGGGSGDGPGGGGGGGGNPHR